MKILNKLIPIVSLICFVCLGLTIIFNEQGLTYLTYKTTADGIKIYNFNLNAYVDNLNINILKRAITNAIDTNTFKNIIEAWKIIWEDGYNFGDILVTILNGFIMVINAFIAIINIILIVLRIASGILLTGMSISGVNINTQGVIIKSLNSILDSAVIQYIQPMLPQ